MNDETKQYVNWFRHSSPYINAHRGNTFVLMLSGESVAEPNFANIVHDIALLNSLGVRLILVHGSRPQISERLQQKSIPSQLHHHLRVTDQETMTCVIEASAIVRAEIEARLSLGLPNTPMAGSRIKVISGNFVTAKPVGVLDGIDMAHTGEVRRIDHEAIIQQLDDGNIVLLSHLGYSPTGELFNLSVEDVATCAATALSADKLIIFGADNGVLDSAGALRSELLTRKAERLVSHYLSSLEDTDQAHTELSRHLEAAVNACRKGVKRCHLISFKEDGALLAELFTRDGSGTMILSESYEQLKKASIEDVGAVLELIRPLEENGTLVRRSREVLENEIERFTLIERDGVVIGCAALYPFADEKVGELACVVVASEYKGGARGDELLRAVEKQAKGQGLEKLFVLTTKTAHWFIERGFVESNVDQLPKEKKALFNLQRNSKVFIRDLG
ncbi:amino-acid N-acetyltransferase [Neptuniibacter sp. 2_MG-2023]|uniref:amino-acid N-acetyltransferase n=1 Tax=Neptuniibacter sp. 2_MG-2023 TaxID=3062671 RepID=UPI0026E2AF46|nr:amino-acid N-acetyltransferase [Neptuniibacter sp. 2_MG-2023]MDO6514968.1 amino-acid N-acetyltransferase [Neptuniibacter sp. 2_MG-2023]